jgi:hypothetical protein
VRLAGPFRVGGAGHGARPAGAVAIDPTRAGRPVAETSVSTLMVGDRQEAASKSRLHALRAGAWLVVDLEVRSALVGAVSEHADYARANAWFRWW